MSQHRYQVADARQREKVFFSQRLFSPFQRSSVHRLGLLILPLALQYRYQVADVRQREKVFFPQRLFFLFQRSSVHRLGHLVLPLILQYHC
jgi:hypothetical protein